MFDDAIQIVRECVQSHTKPKRRERPGMFHANPINNRPQLNAARLSKFMTEGPEIKGTRQEDSRRSILRWVSLSLIHLSSDPD